MISKAIERTPMKRCHTILAAAFFLSLTAGVALPGAPEKLKVLIIDGQNNHNWRGTTPLMKSILEDAGIFTVDVATTPDDLAGFHPRFSGYHCILSNYNGGDWPEETRRAFVDYMKGGGGLVVVHAADNSFPSWKEFNEMIALGGWGGRNEKWGPMAHWEGGKIVLDDSPGAGGTHGPQHAYQIVIRDKSHPITAGLPERWMHLPDELYSKLRGPARNMHMLATAFADPEKGGTGRHEPALFTVRFGKGRVFHTILGHDVQQMYCMGFVFTLQRGTEWAATGKVTLTEVPWNFPTAHQTRRWLPDTAFDLIRTYDFGDHRKELAAIEESLRGASPEALKKIELKLLDALDAPETKYAGKQYVLRLLRRIGSAQSLESLAGLLRDEKLSHMARFALQRLPCPGAAGALLDALKESQGDLRIGIIGSLGDRGEPEVVPALVPYLTHGEKSLVRTAIKSLARIGTSEAARALAEMKADGEILHARNRALLACADALLARGAKGQALDLYRKLTADRGSTSLVRLAAHRGTLLVEGEKAVPAVLSLLRDGDPVLRQGAVQLISRTPGTALTRALAERLSSLGPDDQVILMGALVDRGEKIACPAVQEAAGSPSEKVRIAALGALGTLGDARTVDLLARRLLADGPEGEAAFQSLTALGGEGVAPAIVHLVDSAPTRIRLKAIEALVIRHEAAALPALVGAAMDGDPEVRGAVQKALGALGGLGELSTITRLMMEATEAGDRSGLAGAVRSIAERIEERDAASGIFAAALGRADGPARVSLLGALSLLSTENGLEAVRGLTGSPDAAVVKAAVQALADWRNPAPLKDLLALAKRGSTPELRAVALRGYIRQVSIPANRPSLETVRLLSEAIALTSDVDVKKGILSSLVKFPCKEALALAESNTGDPALGEVARGVAQAIKGIFLKSGIVATASHNSQETRNAFDGNLDSRWSTGTPMRPGMWFMVDLGLEQKVTRLILDTRNSPGDYPRGSEVYISFDGKSWGEPVLKSGPQRPITRLIFPEPVRARFIKIVQTGRTEGLFWSIHELKIAVE